MGGNWRHTDVNMKLIKSDGKNLKVYDIGPCVYELEADRIPIKVNGTHILTDDKARDLLRTLSATRLYRRLPV